MTHYYTDNDKLASKPISFHYVFDNEEFDFISDNGVFSKDSVDYGSYLLLKNIYKLNLGKTILDLGSGYGVIGIILKRHFPQSQVHAVDVNSRATSLTSLNAKNNQVDIKVYQTDDITSLNTNYDSIVLNPPIRAGKRVIFGLYEKAYLSLNEGGRLFIVILKKHGANSSYDRLKELYKNVNILDKIHGHWIIEAIK